MAQRDRRDFEKEIDSTLASVVLGLLRELSVDKKELRILLWQGIKRALPLKRGKPLDPQTAEGVRLYQEGKGMKEILPIVLGKPRPTKAEDSSIWDSAAENVEKKIRRQLRKLKKHRPRRGRIMRGMERTKSPM